MSTSLQKNTSYKNVVKCQLHLNSIRTNNPQDLRKEEKGRKICKFVEELEVVHWLDRSRSLWLAQTQSGCFLLIISAKIVMGGEIGGRGSIFCKSLIKYHRQTHHRMGIEHTRRPCTHEGFLVTNIDQKRSLADHQSRQSCRNVNFL